MFRILTLILALVSSSKSFAYEFSLGVGTGICSTSAVTPMCNQGKPTFHVYVRASKNINNRVSVYHAIHHYSTFDGEEDFNTRTSDGSGYFNFIELVGFQVKL